MRMINREHKAKNDKNGCFSLWGVRDWIFFCTFAGNYEQT